MSANLKAAVACAIVLALALSGSLLYAADRGGAPPAPAQQTQGQLQAQQTTTQAEQSALPTWQVGQQWQVQSQTYQMQAMGDPQWLQPVQWQYQVTGQQQVAQQQCNVVQVTQQGAPAPTMTLYVAQRDLNLVQVDTQVMVGGQQQLVTQQFGPGMLPVYYQLGPAPTQLPQFQQTPAQDAWQQQQGKPTQKTFKALVPAGGGVTFEAEVTQTIEAIDGAQLRRMLPEPATQTRALQTDEKLLQVKVYAPGYASTQVIASKSPWPVYSETPTQRSWLVGVTDPGAQGGM